MVHSMWSKLNYTAMLVDIRSRIIQDHVIVAVRGFRTTLNGRVGQDAEKAQLYDTM